MAGATALPDRRPMRPCPKCGRLYRDGLCPAHIRSSAAYRPNRTRAGGVPEHVWRRIAIPILVRDEHRCQYCLGVGGTVDHILPRSRGGSNNDENLCACCNKCNESKGPRTVREWIDSGLAPRTASRMLDRGDKLPNDQRT